MRNRPSITGLAALLLATASATTLTLPVAAAPDTLAGYPWVGAAPTAAGVDGHPWAGSTPQSP